MFHSNRELVMIRSLKLSEERRDQTVEHFSVSDELTEFPDSNVGPL